MHNLKLYIEFGCDFVETWYNKVIHFFKMIASHERLNKVIMSVHTYPSDITFPY